MGPMSQQLVIRIILSYILENCLQINLQITLLAMQRCVMTVWPTQSTMQAQAWLSIGLSIVTSSLKLLEAKAFFSFAATITDMSESYMTADDKAALRRFNRNVAVVRVACVVLALSLVYGVCKILAAFLCEHSMWNITGCVDMGDLLASH